MADSNSGGGGLGLGALISGGVDLARGIFGAFQAAKGTRQMNRLLTNRPQYNISQGYLDAFKTYQNMANSQLPGYNTMLGQIGESGAKANTLAERGAMSSNQLMSSALQSQDKELDAIKNLGIMSAQWRAQQQQQLAGAQTQMGQLQDTQWDYNVNQPWQIRANMANEQRQSGFANLFGGAQGAASTLNNYLGTSAYMRALNSLRPQNTGTFVNPLQQGIDTATGVTP